MKKLKGALIGCGFFAENHILAWKELKNIEKVKLKFGKIFINGQ